jgi:hypothetical protein
MSYSKVNTIGGWVTFFIATIVYYITIEDTMSLWDCSEYILSAYKLEVGHPPGAPLFMMLGRLFSFFVDTDKVAFMVNLMSALSSSFTILFMYWTISLLAKKMAFMGSRELSQGQVFAIQSSAFVGALAYAFTETFWFSAVEGEVYAMASLFTAIIFWAILKWDEETRALRHGELLESGSPTRWLILIFFLLGLAIGVHLLGILALPALAYVIYFNKWEKTEWSGFLIAGVIGVFTLAFVQEGIIPGIVSLTSSMEIFSRNSLGLPFNVGAMSFFVLIAVILVGGIVYTQKKGYSIANTVMLSITVLLIGYGSFAMIVIRSNADTPMNQNSPKTLVNLHSYLKREQYGSAPLLSGPYWNSQIVDSKSGSPKHQRKFTVIKNEEVSASFYSRGAAQNYVSKFGGEIKEQYAMIFNGEGMEPVYAEGHTTFLPRMFESREPGKIDGYKRWSGYETNGPLYSDKPSINTTDSQRLPTFGENIKYMWDYQFEWMYLRYFMWNFAGRQNDIQGHGDIMQGNWKSGIGFIDNMRLGDQDLAPNFTKDNPSNNSFYFLPLILGLIGLFFHIYKSPKDAFVVFLLFLMTGLAIVLYLNQRPFEPRERDYAYAASFYAFAIWIGLGAYALFEAYKSLSKEMLTRGLMIAGALSLFFVVFNTSAFLSVLFMSIIGGGAMTLMYFMKEPLKNDMHAAILSLGLTIIVPVNLGVQGFDDHDRGDRSIGLDMAKNYMNSCAENSILFTHGDNDTFPLWYLQEVERMKTSVRVYNLSLGQTDWYTEQMTMKVYDSEPLPIKFSKDQYAMFTGNMDNVYFLGGYLDLKSTPEISDVKVEEIFKAKIDNNRTIFENNLKAASFQLASILSKSRIAEKNTDKIQKLVEPYNRPGFEQFKYFMDLTVAALQNGEAYAISREDLEIIQKNATDFENSFDYLPIGFIMDFVRDDNNVVQKTTRDGGSLSLRIFPSSGFIIPVDRVDNMIKNGIISKEESKNLEPVKFRIEASALSREQVMILDILANFEWNRPIYFSNPYPSEVGKALFMSGYVAMEGMVFQLTPIRGKTIDEDKMYTNLMEKYLWGNMDKPGVLLDYYTRRTALGPYKNSFFRLAETYYNKMELESRGEIQDSLNDSSVRSLSNSKKIEEYRKKGIAVCLRAFELMPVGTAIDYGEPTSSLREPSPGSESQYSFSYSHGNMHSFVRMLFAFGDDKNAEKYGMQVADDLESIIDFCLETDPRLASLTGDYLFSSIDAYLEMRAYAEPGKFLDRTTTYINKLKGRFDSLVNKMKADDAGKDRESRNFENTIQEFQLRWEDLFELYM